MAAESVTDSVFVDVWGYDGTFGVIDVIDPLVVNLRVSELLDAFNVVYGFLVGLLLVEESGSCVIGELA